MASTWRPSSVNILPPTFTSVSPTLMGAGAAGGAGLPVEYKPVTAVTTQTWLDGAVTLIDSPNCPLNKVVALLRQTQGAVITAEQTTAVIDAEPLILAVHPPWVWVATTVYVPGANWLPKEMAAPVPATGAPTLLPFRRSW